MDTLRTMLDAYRHRGVFPSYGQLQPLAATCPGLATLLAAYQAGASFPTYDQLALLAYP